MRTQIVDSLGQANIRWDSTPFEGLGSCILLYNDCGGKWIGDILPMEEFISGIFIQTEWLSIFHIRFKITPAITVSNFLFVMSKKRIVHTCKMINTTVVDAEAQPQKCNVALPTRKRFRIFLCFYIVSKFLPL